jgi:hypothetical protein
MVHGSKELLPFPRIEIVGQPSILMQSKNAQRQVTDGY